MQITGSAATDGPAMRKGVQMSQDELMYQHENPVVASDNGVSRDSDVSVDEGVQTVSRSKVRVLQYSRSDLLI
jgi:hypothetical protein